MEVADVVASHAFAQATTRWAHQQSEVGSPARDFSHGRWQKLIDAGLHCVEEAATAVSRKRRRTNQQSDVERRAVRAQSLVQLGELSAGRQALEGPDLAPGSIQTRQELSNPQRRPPHPREPLPADLLTFQPANAFELNERKFSKNLQSFRRGAAPGPSGMSAEHFRPCVAKLRAVAQFLPETNRRSSWHCATGDKSLKRVVDAAPLHNGWALQGRESHLTFSVRVEYAGWL